VGSAAVKGYRKSALKLHKPADVGMVLLLVRHDPAFGIKVDNMLEVLRLDKEKNCQKEFG